MATTPNFNWSTPDNTGLVRNGALDIRTLGDSIDASLVDLKGGTTGQVLSKASNTDMDFTWVTDAAGDITGVTAGTGISGGGTSGTVTVTNSMATAIDAKGDLIGGTGADTFARLAVGTNGQVLTADSAETTGLKWTTPAGGSSTFVGASVFRASPDQAISNNTWTSVNFTGENYDTDAFHDNSTNNTRLTIPTGKGGYYQINGTIGLQAAGTSAEFNLRVLKNGTAIKITVGAGTSIDNMVHINFATSLVATDYIELQVIQTSGSSKNLFAGNLYCLFACNLLGV